jgi:molecular chaperone DnaK (HSP70)
MDIGIDLGTTFSVMAIEGQVDLASEYPSGVYIAECDVTIIPSPFGEITFPSVVIENPESPGSLLFGSEALEAADESNAPILFSKRRIGTSEVLRTGSMSLSARDVAEGYLVYLKTCAERALGRTVSRAIVTHPAYFGLAAIDETRDAARRAGFDMSQSDQMLMEPVAAALAYVRTDPRDPLNILSYDLGGGTFDVSVLQRSGGVIDMRAFDGDHLLGGYNFDRELVSWVRSQVESRGRRFDIEAGTDNGRAAIAGLLRAAENVKIALANAESDDRMVEFRVRGVVRDVAGRDIPINERLSRQQFVGLIKPHLDRTVERCVEALKKAKLRPADIDEVILVGGSSYAPWVKEVIAPVFPHLKPKLFSPDLCVAVGAAIHARNVLPRLVAGATASLRLDVPAATVT